jgi:hypothetical protein
MKKDYDPLDGSPPETSKSKLRYGLYALLLAVILGLIFFNHSDPKFNPTPTVDKKKNQDPVQPKDDPNSKDPVDSNPNKDPVITAETKSLVDFKIVKTYKRLGQQYYT